MDDSPVENGGMRIGIDARMWDESGIGRYLRNLVKNLSEIDSENEYILFTSSKIEELGNKFEVIKVVIPWYGIDEQLNFPKIIKRARVDLMHFPHFNVPILYRGKYVVTIHDLIHHKFAMRRASTLGPVSYWVKQTVYRLVFDLSLIKAKKIITVSEYVKEELVSDYHVSKAKVEVTKEGVDSLIIKLAKTMSDGEAQSIRDKLKINQPYFFYVGNAHPHKNIERLVESFRKVRNEYPDMVLVLAGKENYFWQKLLRYQKTDGVVYLGKISDEVMVGLYKGASAYVMPSLEEGFGLPILEAFTCGTPVISSKKASLPEVGGDACLYFDPENIDDMASKMREIIENSDLRRELVQKGGQRQKLFSWHRLAEQTLEVYRRAA